MFFAAVPVPALTAGVLVPYAVLVPYSKYTFVAWPFGLTLPFSVAVVSFTLEAAFVVTTGAADVKNAWSEPRLVPASFVATRRMWYVRPALSPVTDAATEIAVEPDPASLTGVFVP
jgi:hypothetical protein